MTNLEHGGIELEFDSSCYDASTAAFAMLAFGLSKLPVAEREARLVDIEERLRQTARRFELSRPSPYPRVTNGHVAHWS